MRLGSSASRPSASGRALALALAALPLAACSSEPPSAPPPAGTAPPKEDPPKEDPPKEDPPVEAPPEPLPAIEGIAPLADENPDPGVVEVSLVAKASTLQIAPGAPTKLWTYNDVLPGPLVHARVGDRVIIHFENDLDEPTVVHWHGLRISDRMDGSPRIQTPVEPGAKFTYDFVVPDAGTFWYHTHFRQIEQFERGLYGALVVHELDAPEFTTERIVMVDDIRLSAENQISGFATSGHDIGAGRIGNTLLANGKAEPVSATIARGAVERWRVVLSTNALGVKLRTTGANSRVVATDGGLLPTAISADGIRMAPGQRYDLEVSAAEDAAEVRLEALIQTVNSQNQVEETPFPLVVAKVEGEVAPPPLVYPLAVHPSTDVVADEVAWKVSGSVVEGKVVFTINGEAGYATDHDHPLLGTFAQNAPVKITLSSNVSPAHPFHLHGQFFQIVERGGKPVTNEPGLRDTVEIRGGQTVSVLTYFENPGLWMAHCHISEHSENGMMAEIEVTESASGSASSSGASGAGGHSQH